MTTAPPYAEAPPGHAPQGGAAAPRPQAPSPLRDALDRHRWVLTAIGLFSLVINLLMLAGPLFMMQVYDRVLTSRSVPTLLALFAITAALFAVMGLLEVIRSRVLVRLSLMLDRDLAKPMFEAEVAATLSRPGKGVAVSPVRELETVRQFVAGPSATALFDLPWVPVYLLVIFLLHPVLGLCAVAGAALLMLLAVANELSTARSRQAATEAQAGEIRVLEGATRSAESIKAMGMFAALRSMWIGSRNTSLALQDEAGARASAFAAIARSLRLFLQSAMLAAGAWLVIQDQITAGMIIAVTVIFGRALQPIDQIIGQWRGMQRAHAAHKTVTAIAAMPLPFAPRMQLPAPKGIVEVDDLRVMAPGTQRMILKRRQNGKGVSFSVGPGRVLGIIGPSGSGKSTLARALVGIWPAAAIAGRLDLDGMPIAKWDPHQLGRAIGYLPQEVELIAGSVRQNIARFDPDAKDEAVLAAAALAGVNRLVAELPEAYDTQIGPMGTAVSAGQRQRIALARALYGDPALVVLDEPNSNLDNLGEDALQQAVNMLRERGRTVIVVSHRPDVLKNIDLLLVLGRGEPQIFGPRAEVLANLRFLSQQAGARRTAEAGGRG
jgi:ATP-binding cassette subfamily C protein